MDKVINIKRRKLNCYDEFEEKEMSDGRFILVNLYNGEGGTFKESVIDKIDNDEFWEECDKYFWEEQ